MCSSPDTPSGQNDLHHYATHPETGERTTSAVVDTRLFLRYLTLDEDMELRLRVRKFTVSIDWACTAVTPGFDSEGFADVIFESDAADESELRLPTTCHFVASGEYTETIDPGGLNSTSTGSVTGQLYVTQAVHSAFPNVATPANLFNYYFNTATEMWLPRVEFYISLGATVMQLISNYIQVPAVPDDYLNTFPGTFRGDDVDLDVATRFANTTDLSFDISDVEWWPYEGTDDPNPIWDVASGDELIDHRTLTL